MEEERENPPRIGITGSGGNIGKTLIQGLSDKYIFTLFDKKRIEEKSTGRIKAVAVDLSNAMEIPGIFNGLDVVIHLAADARPTAQWDSILKNNIMATYNVFEEAKRAGVRRVIFASTNHVQHGYTIKSEPDTIDLAFYEEDTKIITLNDPPAPDSLYAVSKLFGEDLGRYYALRFGLQFVALRIGWTIPQDDPSIKRNTRAEYYMRAMFLSKRDCVTAFSRALQVEMKAGEVLLGYAISKNDRRVFDLTETRARLGFNPLDNAETYF